MERKSRVLQNLQNRENLICNIFIFNGYILKVLPKMEVCDTRSLTPKEHKISEHKKINLMSCFCVLLFVFISEIDSDYSGFEAEGGEAGENFFAAVALDEYLASAGRAARAEAAFELRRSVGDGVVADGESGDDGCSLAGAAFALEHDVEATGLTFFGRVAAVRHVNGRRIGVSHSVAQRLQ